VTLTLNDLTCLVPVSNNLLEDASATSSVVSQAIGAALNWKFNEAIINGGGAGMPLGILNAGNLVTVAKESGQAASTITVNNLISMYARILTKQNGVWFVTPQGSEQIMKMVQPGGLLPAAFRSDTGFSQSPLPTIYGLPVVTLENCSALGQKGDIILADMKGYVAITKNIQMATSIHMFFDTNATAFRAVARMDGKPWAKAPVVSAHDATFKRSQFVTLAARP
jgi:HK97 family phage major capsid protein